MILKKYITNVRALQFFQIFRFGILFLISVIFTKTKLNIGEIGVYETFILIAGSVSFFWMGGMLQSLLSNFNNNKFFKSNEKSPLLFNVFILFVLFSLFSAILVFSLQPVIANIFSLSGDKIPYMKILFMYLVFSGPANLIEYIYLLKNQSARIVIYGISTFTVQLFCVTVPVLLGYDLGYGLYGLVFINMIRFIWLSILIYKYSEFKLSIDYIKDYLKLSLPLILSMLLSGSANYIDGFIISFRFSEASFAIFRYGARELPFIILLTNAFGNAMTPKIADIENRANSMKELKDGTLRLMHYLYPTAILFILTSKYLYPIVFNPQFLESATIFNIYILIILTRFVFARIILIGIQKTNIILYSSLIEIILNVCLSLILINYYGIVGVAYATVIAYAIEKMFLVIVLKYKYNINLREYLNIKTYIIYSIALLISFVVNLVIPY